MFKNVHILHLLLLATASFGCVRTSTSESSLDAGRDTAADFERDTAADLCIPPDANGAPVEIAISAIQDTALCPGQAIEVPYVAQGAIDCGNTFTVQLSDAVGSFTSFVNIGTVASLSSGTIIATVPGGTAPGTGYRVRVISSAPYTISPVNDVDLTIHASPDARFSFSPLIGLDDGSTLITFTAASQDAATYAWSFGAGASTATSTSANPVVSYSTAGAKVVSLTITSSAGCQNTQTSDGVWDLSRGLSPQILSCTPTIPSNANVVKDQRTASGTVWICPGGSALAGGGSMTAFVENGGIFSGGGGGSHLVYVKASGQYITGQGGSITIVHEPGAAVGAGFKLECATLSFDLSQAPAGGCL